MAITNTTRFSLTQWSSGDDDFSREQLTTDFETISNDAALFLSGTSATPPSAAGENTRAFYWDKTNGVLYYRGDTLGVSTASWSQIHPVIASSHVHADLQPLNSELTAISSFTTTGFISRTASATYVMRQIAVSGSGITISNPSGDAGNPTISLNSVSTNTPSTIVLRDSSGNFSAGTVTASLTGNASTATTWQTARSLTVSGDVSGTVSGINGGSNISISLSLPTGNLSALRDFSSTGIVARTASNTYSARSIAVSGNGISISNADAISGNPTISINAVSTNTVSSIVLRDASGNFGAGTITASLTGNASTATAWQTARSLTVSGDVSGTVSGINGGANITISLSLPTGNLTALRDLSFTGLMARTASNTYSSRSIAVSGTGLAISNADAVAGNPTISSNATSANTASTIVARDASGQFQIGTPTVHDNPTTKLYVDTANALKADAADVYTKTEIHSAKLYQYANEAGGTGTALPSSGTRTTPRIYVQSNEPSSAGAITGDIWFQI